MASSSSSVSTLSAQLAKKCSITQKTTKHVSMKNKGAPVDSFALIGYTCREGAAVTRGALNYALRTIWGTDHTPIIFNTNRRNVFIFRIQRREIYHRILRGKPHSIHGHLMVLMPWDFNMNVHQVIFQFEIFFVEFRLRSDLERDNIPYMIASQAGEVINVFNRDRTGVVKARVKVDVNLPLCRKLKLTLEDGETVKISIFYLGVKATCRSCYVMDHSEQYCELVANLAWMNEPVFNLQGVDPFNEEGVIIEGDAVVPNIAIESMETQEVERIQAEVDNNDHNQDNIIIQEPESAPTNSLLTAQVFVSSLPERSEVVRGVKRKRAEDVLADQMELDALNKDINAALITLAEAVTNEDSAASKEKWVWAKALDEYVAAGESSNSSTKGSYNI